MALIGKIFAWIVQNILAIAVITIILLFLAPGIRVAKDNAAKLTEQREGILADIRSLDEEIASTTALFKKDSSMLDYLRSRRDECQEKLDNRPNLFLHPIDYSVDSYYLLKERETLDIEISVLEAAIAQYNKSFENLSQKRNALVSQLDGIPKTLYNELANEWNARGIKMLLFAIVFVLVTPRLWLVFMYYAVAAVIEKAPPIRIRTKDGEAGPEPIFHRAARSITFTIPEGRKFYLRAQGGDWGKERRDVTCRTKFLWRWSAPLVSAVAELVELLAYSREPGSNRPGQIKLTSPRDDEVYIQQIELNGGPGLVLMPRHVIGLTDDVEVRTVWSFKLHNLISMRLRHIIFYGTGTIFIIGGRGIDVQRIESGSSAIHKIEDGVLIGYVPGAAYSLCRTQTFWAYFRGMTSLLDYKLCGGTFLTQNLVGKNEKEVLGSGMDRFLSVLLNGIGKLLGF